MQRRTAYTSGGSDVASASKSNAKFDVRDFGAQCDAELSGSTWVGTDDSAAIEALMTLVEQRGGGTLVFPANSASLVSLQHEGAGQRWILPILGDNISIEGAGGSLIVSNEQYVDDGFPTGLFQFAAPVKLGGSDNAIFSSNTQFATVYPMVVEPSYPVNSITLSSPADAANFAAGDVVMVRAGQTINNGAAINPDSELHELVAVDAASGVLTLRDATTKPYRQEYAATAGAESSETVDAFAYPTGVSNVTDRVVRNFSLRKISLVAPGLRNLIQGQGALNVTVEDVEFEVRRSGFNNADVRCLRATRLRGHLTSQPSENVSWAVAPSTGCTDWTVSDSVFSAETSATVHAHEGVSGLAISNCRFAGSANNGNNSNLLSIRGRSYGTRITGSQFHGFAGPGVPTAFISSNCEAGGVISGCEFTPSSSGTDPAFGVAGSGWRMSGNVFNGSANDFGTDNTFV